MLSIQLADWSHVVFWYLTKTYQVPWTSTGTWVCTWIKQATIPLVHPGVQKISDRPATLGHSKHLLQVISGKLDGEPPGAESTNIDVMYPIMGHSANKRTNDLTNEHTDQGTNT